MTVKTANFIEDWFFDSFCRMSDIDRDEFIKRLWGLYRCTNEKDVEICKSEVDAKLNDDRIMDYYDNMKREDDLEPSYDPDPDNDEMYEIEIDDVRDLLSDYAHDVIYELYCDDLLPNEYVNTYKKEMNGLQ